MVWFNQGLKIIACQILNPGPLFSPEDNTTKPLRITVANRRIFTLLSVIQVAPCTFFLMFASFYFLLFLLFFFSFISFLFLYACLFIFRWEVMFLKWNQCSACVVLNHIETSTKIWVNSMLFYTTRILTTQEWTTEMCIFSKNKATLDKVSNGSD